MKYGAVHTPARAVPFVVRASCKFPRTSFPFLLLLPILLITPQLLKAQAVYGSIVGTVADPTGAVIPGATVTVTDVSKGISQTVTANASGNYEVTRLVPDVYQVKVTFHGFAPSEADNVVVTADNAQQVNLQMKPAGADAQTVTVTTAPPPLETEEQQVSQNLDERQVQSLPNINRNASEFALLTPGVQRASFSIDPTENPQGTVAVEANGMNYGTIGWLLDGTDNREPVLGIIVVNPTLDSLSNMEIITSNYPAEFGGAVGGFITAQTKSGSNTFHGDAFDFRRSGALAARDPFTQYPGIPFPGQLYNQFGGSIGGPILKNRAFFFLDYQGTRQRVGQTVQTNVPTALVRSTCLSGAALCDLSQYPSSTVNPATKQPAFYSPVTQTYYPVNAVPLSALTPQGIALLRAFPMPNSGAATSTTNNYVASGNGEYNGDQADIRLDAQVKPDIHSFARYDYSNFRLFGTPVFGPAGGTGFGIGNTTGTDNAQNQSAALGADWAINQNFLTDVRFGFLDYHISENKYDAGTYPASAIGLPNLNTSVPGTSGSPTYTVEDNSISSFGNQGCNCPLLESEQVFQLANNWTKLVGNHSIRFGGDIRYALNLRNASDYNQSGVLSFGNGSTGSGIASVLMGYVDTFQRYDIYSLNASNRQKRGSFYAEDRWRITPTFTLNYGLRWDIVFPETVNRPESGGFTNLNTGYIQVAGVGGFGTNGGAKVDLSDFGGRLGFAWQPRPRIVLRAAAAQMYDDEGMFGTIFGSVLTHNIPVYNDEDVTSGNATGKYSYTYGTLPAAPPPYYVPPTGLIPLPNGVNTEIRPITLILPRVDQYNLSLQQQITNDMTYTIGVVGNVAERIYPGETYGYNVNEPRLPTIPADLTATDPNPPAPCVPGSPAGCSRDQRRPYYDRFSHPYNGLQVNCCTQDITSAAPAAHAHYTALEMSVEQRFSHGLQFDSHYTWSRAMNYSSTYFAQNPLVEYGPTDTNRRNVFLLNGLWDLPVGRGKAVNIHSKILDSVVGGWRVGASTTWESGLPFTVTYAECGSDQDIDTNFASPGTSSDCRPNKGVGILPMHVAGLNPVTHSRMYFTPVAPLTTNGAASGPFVRPAFGTFGTVGRNSYRGPSEYFADATLFKTFAITEKVKAQFQFQTYNLFNHAPLGVPNGTQARCIDCSTATGDTGLITSVDSAVSGTGMPYMRTLQFGARFEF